MIQVINRALNILEYLAKNQETRKNLKDISTEFNLNAGTCANILKTLITRKYVVKSEKRDYALGPMAYSLTGSGNYRMDLVNTANSELDKLTKKWNENSLIAIIEEDLRIVLLSSYSINSIQASTESHKKAYNTAVGRILLAKLNEDELKRFIAMYGLPTFEQWPEVKGDEKVLQQLLSKCNKLGFATIVNSEEIIAFAAPVMRNSMAVAGIGIYIPTFRFKKSSQNELINDLMAACKAVGEKL